MEENLKIILEEFERHKGQLVIIGYKHIVRLISIGDDEEDYYYVTYDGKSEVLRWSTCVGPLIPLKGYLREEDYTTLLSIAQGNHWDLIDSSQTEKIRKYILSLDAPGHKLIVEPYWKLN
jgi:hypothetical protein